VSLLLLDTTFLVDAERGNDRLDDLIADDDDVAIAAITVAELLVGVDLASSPKRRRARQDYVDIVVESIPVLNYDTTVATEHAALLVAIRAAGRPRGAHDLIIAATARATSRTVVSSDRSAFKDLPGVTAVDHR